MGKLMALFNQIMQLWIEFYLHENNDCVSATKLTNKYDIDDKSLILTIIAPIPSI